MKHIIKGYTVLLAVSLFAAACSRKSESTVSTSKPRSIDASKPQFTIAAADLAVPSKIGTNSAPSGTNASIVIHLQFSTEKAEEFRQFTREHLNQKMQLLVGSKVVAEPFIVAEVSGGQADLTFSSLDDAKAVADSLNKR